MSFEEEETVSIKRLVDEDPSTVREVRISCPDATGLGVDFMRLLLDFGLRILRADISTDGTWCFLVLVVSLSSGVPPRWSLLRSRLQEICPGCSDALRIIRHDEPKEQQQAFILHISGYDRQGMLHSLTHALWEADTSVFKAHVTTNADGEVCDTFWLFDNRNELPEEHRIIEICDRIKGALGPDVRCRIQPAPAPSLVSEGYPGETIVTATAPRLSCKDATSCGNLRSIVGNLRNHAAGSVRSSRGTGSGGSGSYGVSDDECVLPSPFTLSAVSEVEVEVDNATSTSYTLVSLRCRDRKGLLYDLFLKLKEVDVRVAYGRVEVEPSTGIACVELFVQDVEGGRISDDDLLRELTERLRNAAALPVRIEVHGTAGGEGDVAELTIAAPVDAGRRGRPRVTYDVTQGLSSAGVGVFSADVYVEHDTNDDAISPMASRSHEMHRFLVHRPDGGKLDTEEGRRALADVVRSCLLGTKPMGASPQWGSETSEGGLTVIDRRASSESTGGGGGLLRSFSSKWKGQQASAGQLGV